jgi:hypothetical protein
MVPNQPKSKAPTSPHLRDLGLTPPLPAPYTPPTHACTTNRYVLILQPEDGQPLWPKHVVVLYI